MSSKKPTVVLNMIVKDESENIEACLASVLPLVDHWVIVDTGSTDDTQEKIRSFFETHPLPGSIHERPWVNFAHNRNEALDLARSSAEYVLFMDADDRMICPENFQWPTSGAGAYSIQMWCGEASYWNLRLVRTDSTNRWKGVVHEYIETSDTTNIEHINPMCNILSGRFGARSRDPNTYLKDAKLLLAEIETDPTDARSWFYLAQSYRDAGRLEPALQAYLKRAELGGWVEEVYCSLLELGRIQIRLEQPWAVAMHTLLSAYDLRPSRIEAIYEVVRYCRINGQGALGYALAQLPSQIRKNGDWLFVESQIYLWKMLDERAQCAMGLGLWAEAGALYRQLLLEGVVPESEVPRFINAIAECEAITSPNESDERNI